ncbi:hypothetical protein Hte_001027 [Hypoxylon texense]
MSRNKRKAVLLEAWLNMPEHHRPDLVAWTAEPQDEVPIQDQDPAPFLWPHINLEDLCKTEPLLLMLDSRAKGAPQDFLPKDLEPTTFAYQMGLIEEVLLPSYYMTFDHLSGESYGRIHSTVPPSKVSVTPGEGLWLLEIQARLYEFLAVCCHLILHDISLDFSKPTTSPPTQTEPPMVLSKSNIDGIEYRTIALFEAPYKAPPPPLVDLDHLIFIVSAMLITSEDHIHHLRTDPSHFAMSLEEMAQHRVEQLLDTNNQQHPIFVNDELHLFWGRVLNDLICESFLLDGFLAGLRHDLVRLQGEVTLHPVEPWAERFSVALDDAVYTLQYGILRILQFLLHESYLARTFFASCPMRQYTRRKVPNPGDDDSFELERYPDIPRSKSVEKLDYLINYLSSDDQGRFILGRKALITEIELLLQRDPEARSLVTTQVAHQLSIVGLLCECLQQISGLHLGMRAEKYRMHQNIEKYTDAFNEKYVCEYDLMEEVKPEFWCILGKDFMKETGGKFQYPVGERRTKETVDTMRQTEVYLDKFWGKLIWWLKNKGKQALPPNIEKIIIYESRKTEPWVEPQPSSKADKRGRSKTQDNEDPFDQIIEKARVENEEAKRKKKETGDKNKTYEVDKRALKVFNALFFDGPDPSQVPEIAWKDFVHAIMAAGFKAEKLLGSGWLFTRLGPCEQGAFKVIHFDEPYMGGKMSYELLRYYGIRLSRRLRWNREMFRLATQSTQHESEKIKESGD